MLSLRIRAGAEQDTLIAAYGVVTRLLSFAFLPQLAIALATQSIAGNNAGAGRNDRALAALRLAMWTAFLWCLAVALIGIFKGATLGNWISPANHRQISIRFDTPVDVVSFESVSNLRREIRATIDENGRSHRHTSNGEPQLLVERER